MKILDYKVMWPVFLECDTGTILGYIDHANKTVIIPDSEIKLDENFGKTAYQFIHEKTGKNNVPVVPREGFNFNKDNIAKNMSN